MRHILILCSLYLLSNGCARIPLQSVELMENISREGNQMHRLNVAFVNSLFNNRKAAIDTFIAKEYLPYFLNAIKKQIPAGTDMNKEWPGLVEKVLPEVNLYRDSLQTALADSRKRILDKLEANHQLFQQACTAEKELLASAVKVNDKRKGVYNQFKGLSNEKIDINRLEAILEEWLKKGGNAAGKITELHEEINDLFNNL